MRTRTKSPEAEARKVLVPFVETLIHATPERLQEMASGIRETAFPSVVRMITEQLISRLDSGPPVTPFSFRLHKGRDNGSWCARHGPRCRHRFSLAKVAHPGQRQGFFIEAWRLLAVVADFPGALDQIPRLAAS